MLARREYIVLQIPIGCYQLDRTNDGAGRGFESMDISDEPENFISMTGELDGSGVGEIPRMCL